MDETEQAPEFKKRAVAKIKRIIDITKEDSRVSIVGSVIDVDEVNFVFSIDDSTGKVSVILLDEHMINKVKVGNIVRVIGLVIYNESGVELKGEIVQDYSGLNVDYYNKYVDLLKKEESQ